MAGTFSAKVHKDGPDKLVVESGGVIELKSGAVLQQNAGATATRTVERQFNSGMRAGAGAGWTTAGNTGAALLPASQSAGTLVVPISTLKVGDTIKALKVVAQIESAGGTVTLDADLRKLTNAAADPVDASIGAITQVSVIADTAVAATKTLTTPEVVAADETYYVLITGTTAGSTDIQLLGVTLTVDEA